MKHTLWTYTGPRRTLRRSRAPRGGSAATLMALVLPLLLVLVSCSAGNEGEPDVPDLDPEGKGTIYLTLNVGVIDAFGGEFETRCAKQVATRADEYYFEEATRPNELLRTLDIFVTDGSNVIEGQRSVSYTEQGVLVGSNLTFKLRPGTKNIYLIGNAASLPAEVRAKYSSLTVGETYPASAMADVILSRQHNAPFFTGDQLIPMAETFTLTLANPYDGTDIVRPAYIYRDLFITRVAVKYTFIVFEDLPRLKVRLSNMADKQYLIPRVVYSPTKYSPPVEIGGLFGRDITSYSSPLLPTETQDYELELTGREQIEVTDASGAKRTAYRYSPVYLMESPSPSTSFMVDAGVSIGPAPEDGTEEFVWVGNQPLPNLPRLPRNTHVVVRMSFNPTFKFNLDLAPYRGCVLEPYFGLDPNRNQTPTPTPEPTPEPES